MMFHRSLLAGTWFQVYPDHKSGGTPNFKGDDEFENKECCHFCALGPDDCDGSVLDVELGWRSRTGSSPESVTRNVAI
jgi:hypothetical protein